MIKKFTLCTVICLLTASIQLYSQDGGYLPPELEYPLKVVKSTNARTSIDAPTWVITANKKSLIFYQGWDNAKHEVVLYSATLNSKGKLSKPYRFHGYGTDSPWEETKAVWFEGKGGRPGRGLLFTFYMTNPQPANFTTFRTIKLIAMSFDEKGKHLSGDHLLFNKTADAGESIVRPGIAVVKQEDTANVLLSVMFYKQSPTYAGFTSTDVYFVITDSRGKPKVITAEAAKLGPVGIHGEDEIQTVYIHDAAWNGKRLLAVGELTHMKVVDHPTQGKITEPIRNDLMAYIAVPKKSGEMKYLSRRILSRKSNMNSSFDYVQLLPPHDAASGSSPAGVGDNVLLFYRTQEYVGFEQNSVYPVQLDYALVTVNGRGKKVGKPVTVKMPEWKPGVTYSSDLKLARYGQYVGNILPLSNGRYLVGLNRHLIVWHYGSSPPATAVYSGERQLTLFWFNPVTGYAAIIARNVKKMPASDPPFWNPPLLNLFGKDICVLNQLKPYSVKQWLGTVYFSRFPDLP